MLLEPEAVVCVAKTTEIDMGTYGFLEINMVTSKT